MANLPTQDDAAVNAHADAAAIGTTGSVLGGSHAAAVETPVTATAFQPAGGRDCDLYINIKTAASLAIAMGPTSAAATVISAAQSSALGVVHLVVHAGWYVKLTGTMANLDVTSIKK